LPKFKKKTVKKGANKLKEEGLTATGAGGSQFRLPSGTTSKGARDVHK
jgi:hypothetical protein